MLRFQVTRLCMASLERPLTCTAMTCPPRALDETWRRRARQRSLVLALSVIFQGHCDEPFWLRVVGAGGLEMSRSDPCRIHSRGPSGEPVVRVGCRWSTTMWSSLRGGCRPDLVLAAG